MEKIWIKSREDCIIIRLDYAGDNTKESYEELYKIEYRGKENTKEQIDILMEKVLPFKDTIKKVISIGGIVNEEFEIVINTFLNVFEERVVSYDI